MPQANEPMRVTIENARLIFRNFAGKEGQFNSEGNRNFCVVLDPKTAKQMLKDGWNVKETTPRDEEEVGIPYIQVKVNFKNLPPKITCITDTSRTVMTEAMVDTLDWAEIRHVDLIINASFWDYGGKSGVKAYLKTMFITIEEDELERKYGLMDGGGD